MAHPFLWKIGVSINARIRHPIPPSPRFRHGSNDRGAAYKGKGDHDRAIQDYDEAIRLDPDFAYPHYNRGNSYSYQGLTDRAIAEFSAAIRLDPNYVSAYINRGGAFQRKGLYDRAIADFNKAIELKPDNAHALGHLAWVLSTAPDAVLRNGMRALELAERAVRLDRTAHNLDALSAAYAEMGRFEEATKTQSQAIALAKKNADKISMANFEKRLERYRARRPWRMK